MTDCHIGLGSRSPLREVLPQGGVSLLHIDCHNIAQVIFQQKEVTCDQHQYYFQSAQSDFVMWMGRVQVESSSEEIIFDCTKYAEDE